VDSPKTERVAKKWRLVQWKKKKSMMNEVVMEDMEYAVTE
jgi:hypothetical protein